LYLLLFKQQKLALVLQMSIAAQLYSDDGDLLHQKLHLRSINCSFHSFPHDTLKCFHNEIGNRCQAP